MKSTVYVIALLGTLLYAPYSMMEELHSARHRLIKQYHPDLHMHASEHERRCMEMEAKRINEAFDLLKGQAI